jgi:hypothetical protein
MIMARELNDEEIKAVELKHWHANCDNPAPEDWYLDTLSFVRELFEVARVQQTSRS